MKKLIIISGLILNLIYPSTIFAQESNRPEIRPFQNLTTYFSTFIDFDSNISYLTDDLLITNQCKKRDIFALHSRNDQISAELIQKYTTLTETELNTLKQEYAILNLELKFLRKIDLLAQNNGEELLKDYLISKAKNDYKQLAEDQFPLFLAKYQDSLSEYQNCQNSWSQVAQKVQNIKNNAAQISNDWDTLLITLNSLTETVIATPRGFYKNSLLEGLRNGIDNSAQASWNNLRAEARRINEDLEQLVINPENATFKVLNTINGRSRTSIAEILQTETNLISIAQTVRNQELVGNLDEQLELLQAELTVSNNFSDSANVSLLSSLLYANYAVTEATNTFKNTETGINDQAKKIYQMQCR